ncbi:hypothetical protein [Conexibacter sp. CPCC 206217]|uniref:hypothetical protein n=1 Tax=Conexibacter sp. CPCC 206217 TaxID=3064574 RepID=UPI002720DE92|nr:hypothetical protein [Conexibacter sp. CPCC 206217]MDO8210435.1 hypothetical protein [Conexibacter sp. CPCC 206217]
MGQVDDLPWDAVAIFPEDTVPPARATDYLRATIHYIGLQGRVVNVAEPGGAIDTAEHDADGNVIRALTAANRQWALAFGSGAASEAQALSTRGARLPTAGAAVTSARRRPAPVQPAGSGRQAADAVRMTVTPGGRLASCLFGAGGALVTSMG